MPAELISRIQDRCVKEDSAPATLKAFEFQLKGKPLPEPETPQEAQLGEADDPETDDPHMCGCANCSFCIETIERGEKSRSCSLLSPGMPVDKFCLIKTSMREVTMSGLLS
ncbi:hypothetical protein CRENBAI_006745 [Crenichthys baileyi]|uniref:Uncharacterized protein n=1 Tax=Crenichthys baileyi TaxID=28760 RepID=A0AAV9SR33_9TELE